MAIRGNDASPQFRTALLRKLGNLFPDCTCSIESAGRAGLEFQLFDHAGQPRSNRVAINRPTAGALTESSLVRAIRNAGNPAGGFPPGLS